MKIGILTLPLAYNYGGILQAYALQQSLKRLGHEVYLINRINPDRNHNIKSTFTDWLHKYILQLNTNSFVRKHIHPQTALIEAHSDMDEVVSKYKLDAVIVGSDQVWRLEYSGEIGFNFFLDFVKDLSTKKISYAASFGVDTWSQSMENTETVSKLLKRMDAISVREDSAVELCRNTFNVEAFQVVDPTLLLSKDDYLNLLPTGSDESYRNILTVYILDDSPEKRAIVKKIADHKKLNILPIHVRLKPSKSYLIKLYQCIYPKVSSWIDGFNQADFIVTDSFHGVAFSIIFNKPFVAIGNKNRGLARFKSILKVFGLSDRLVFSSSDLSNELMDKKIDFEAVNAIKEVQKSEALNFLTRALS